MPTPIVKAILVSDIHLSEKSPTFRSSESDWFSAMSRPLKELDRLAADHNVPIVCAGDVFDRWNSSAKLINFSIDTLPKMYSICGQHDLPNHSYNQIESSAYWTLCQAGIITNIENGSPIETKNGLMLHGFHWNQPIEIPATEGSTEFQKFCNRCNTGYEDIGRCPDCGCPEYRIVEPFTSSDLCIHLAVIHKYIWKSKNTSYHDAPEQNHIKNIIKKLKGFDAAVFGDNHKGFLIRSKNGSPTILNNGGFMRRAKDQIDYEPSVGLLFSDGSIKRHKLDCSKDKVRSYSTEILKEETAEINTEDFIQELQDIGSDSLDFEKSIRLYCELNNIEESVFKTVVECIGEC